MVIFALNCPDLTKCAIFTLDRYSSIETAHLCKIVEQSDNYSWRYCVSKNWGIHKVLSRMQFGCLSSHWQFLVCTFWKCRHECSWSSAWKMLNFNGNVPFSTSNFNGYLPSYKVVLQCIGNWQCYATLKSSRTDTQTNSLNTIVLQPLRGSTNKKQIISKGPILSLKSLANKFNQV